MTSDTTLFIRFINRVCHSSGYWVASHYRLTVLSCIVVTCLFTSKLFVTPQKSSLDGYSSENARSKNEFAAFHEFLDSDGQGITLGLLLTAKDNGSMIRDDHLGDTIKLLDLMSSDFRMFDPSLNKSQAFTEFCSGFCMFNEPVRAFHFGKTLFATNDTTLLNTTIETLEDRVKLMYPTSEMFDRKFSLLPNFFGVSQSNETGELEAVKMILLVFRAEKHKSWISSQVKKWELDADKYLHQTYKSDLITVRPYSHFIIEKEILKAGQSLIPFLGVGFVVMCVFCSVTTILPSFLVYNQKPTINKIVLSIVACVNPFMACGTALGVLFCFGVRFSPLLCITPFLVLAISVDDSFLMLHAWNRISERDSWNGREQYAAENIAQVLVQTGPAITISALTNILAFVIGGYSSPPEIWIFSIGNAACIFVDCLYQATFYAGMMAWLAEDTTLEEKPKKFTISLRTHLSSFLSFYVAMLESALVAVAVVLAWMAYLGVSIYGITQLTIDLSSQKMFLYDSDLVSIDKMRTELVIPYYYPATIVVNNPGNLSDSTRLNLFLQMKKELEELPESIGAEATKCFLDDYLPYRNQTHNEITDDEELSEERSLDAFLDQPDLSYWKGFIKINQTKDIFTRSISDLNAFMFTTGYHGDTLREWSNRGALLEEWREVIDRYPTFNATVFTDDAFFLDLLLSLPSLTWQSVVATLVCMAVVCLVFMTHVVTVVFVSINILSVCLGVFGLLSLMGIPLDPILMSISIMCIGFSVDIPAHVAYHYFTSGHHIDSSKKKKNVSKVTSNCAPVQVFTVPCAVMCRTVNSESTVRREEERHANVTKLQRSDFHLRLRHTLASVGFPVLQAGISTDLCALPLAFVQLYMANLFSLAMTVCVTLSLIHGLIVLPALFSLQARLAERFSSNQSINTENTETA